MTKKTLLVSCAALSLLLSGLVGCNNAEESKDPSKSSGTAAPATSNPTNAPTSAASGAQTSAPTSATPTPDANQAVVSTLVSTLDSDNNGETIQWEAQDPNKDATPYESSGWTKKGFGTDGKFNSSDTYVQYTFNASMAMKARLFVECLQEPIMFTIEQQNLVTKAFGTTGKMAMIGNIMSKSIAST